MTRDEQRYNGWTNYETWCVELWLDNDESSQNYWDETAQLALDDAEGDHDAAARNVADRLKDEIEEGNPLADRPASLYLDLLTAAIGETNWHEIASAFLADKTYETDAEDE